MEIRKTLTYFWQLAFQYVCIFPVLLFASSSLLSVENTQDSLMGNLLFARSTGLFAPNAHISSILIVLTSYCIILYATKSLPLSFLAIFSLAYLHELIWRAVDFQWLTTTPKEWAAYIIVVSLGLLLLPKWGRKALVFGGAAALVVIAIGQAFGIVTTIYLTATAAIFSSDPLANAWDIVSWVIPMTMAAYLAVKR